jgi:CPA2 family monovalent cation:H+ antiporter-2
MHSTLELVLTLLATAVFVVVVFRQLRLPALIGYLLVGILIGPHALGWVADREDTRYLAEFGVVFLMFSIGLEFSLPKLVTMRRVVPGLGAAQVGATTLFVIGLASSSAWAGGRGWCWAGVGDVVNSHQPRCWRSGFGFNSQHGRDHRRVLFQDLAVVPFLILIPAPAHSAEDLAKLLLLALVKAAVVLGVVLFLGQRLMRPRFHLVARQKSPELFMLNLLLFTLALPADRATDCRSPWAHFWPGC